MRPSHLLLLATALSVTAYADVLVLNNGNTVKGDFQSADANEIRVEVDGTLNVYPIAEVASISFESRNTTSPNAAAKITAGTIVVRTIDSIDSKTSQVGQTFRASLDEPLTVDGVELPRGADALLRLTEARSAGRLRGSAELTITLASVTAGGKVYEVDSDSVSIESDGKGKSSATKVGVGAGAGAILGGLFGGGKGAAIGAGAGAAAGTAVAMTRGPQVQIPTETRLTFKLQ